MNEDVVATIDAILNGEDNFILLVQRPQLERIRDEIVALREQLKRQPRGMDAIAHVRAEALEEAAQMCFRANPQSNPNAMGHAIRALKDKRDD